MDLEEMDYSVLRDPLLTSVQSMMDYAKCLQNSTSEVTHVLSNEVNIILECKVCRKLFRSLANLLMHKRTFCKTTNRWTSFIPESFKTRGKENVPLNEKIEEDIMKEAKPDQVSESENVSFRETSPAEIDNKTESCQKTCSKETDDMMETIEPTEDISESQEDFDSTNEKENGAVDDTNWRTFCDTATLTCKICGQKYSSIKTLKFHCLNIHGKTRTFYSCLYCKLVFCQPWSCRRHMERSHNKTREQVVKLNESIKQRSFAVPLSQLTEKGMPKLTHSDRKLALKMPKIKPRELGRNSKTMKKDVPRELVPKKNNRFTNQIMKKGKTAFSCYNCGREYDVKGSLNKHIHRRSCFGGNSTRPQTTRREITSGLDETQLEQLKKYVDTKHKRCRCCSRKFTNISNLNRHVVRHVGISRFKCTLCEFKCYNMGECRRHLMRTHLTTEYQKYVVNIDNDTKRDSPVSDVEETPNVPATPDEGRHSLEGRSALKRVGTPRRTSSRRKQDLTDLRADYSIDDAELNGRFTVEFDD